MRVIELKQRLKSTALKINGLLCRAFTYQLQIDLHELLKVDTEKCFGGNQKKSGFQALTSTASTECDIFSTARAAWKKNVSTVLSIYRYGKTRVV